MDVQINKRVMKDIDKMEKDITNHMDEVSSLTNSHLWYINVTIGTTTMIYIYRG